MIGTELRPPSTGRSRRAVVLLAVLALVLLVVVAAGVVFARQRFAGPADFSGPGTGSVRVEVSAGETASQIAQALTHAGVVASAQAFIDAAVADERSQSIQPGTYELRRGMSGQAAVGLLLNPDARVSLDVTIPEGLRIDEILDLLVQATGLPRDDFVRALKQPDRLKLPAYARGDPEGFLFPATYRFDPGTSAAAMLAEMVSTFRLTAADLNVQGRARAVSLDPRQVVTVASIVQEEVAERDFAKAARVIYNRLATGTPLQMDSTVNYALGTSDLTLKTDQLQVDSPYNTYLNVGLPPGPIGSPGRAALEAALAPAEGNWTYFIAVAPGSDRTRFTADYDQFLQWKDEFYAAVNQ